MTWLQRFKDRKKTWNHQAINELADFIEQTPGTEKLGNIVWHSMGGVWPQFLNPVNGVLERGKVTRHLGLHPTELYKAIHPITEKAVPAGVTIDDLTGPVVVNMLRNLAKTGKVVWNVTPKSDPRPL
jgi:hypothetical protein